MTRQCIAMLLLACLGMLIPTAASPMRICRLESSVHFGGFKSYGEVTTKDGHHKEKCCPDCGSDEKDGDSCCFDLAKLPDATQPSSAFELAPMLPVALVEFQISVERIDYLVIEVFEAALPIRGPTDQGRRRATLGVWTI